MFDESVIFNVLIAPIWHFLNPGDRLSLIYQFTALVVAILVYTLHNAQNGRLQVAGLVKWLVPMAVLRHPSTQADFAFFVVNRMLRAGIYGSVLFWTPLVSENAGAAFAWAFGPPSDGFGPHLGISLLMAFVTLILTDMTLWFMHYVFHIVPWLWDYHKVHHSAEVMTPITAARMHPVEEITDAACVSIVTGISYAAFVHAFGDSAVIFSVFDTNVFLAVFFLAAFNLRHSHVWVRYPVWLQHIFICPAQHQIHHSKAPQHWDRNMGFVFACWDWAAGTLYAPKAKEDIDFGLGTEEDGGAWHSLTALYFRPFCQTYARIFPDRKEADKETLPNFGTTRHEMD
ncbi:MAG: sterol desaturase family protein [Pseudomonadota bacterium]